MTKNEVEIIVTAKVEDAIKEFKKIVPEIKKITKEVQESFNAIDTKQMTNNVKNAVQSIKNNMESLKQANKNNIIKLTVNNKDAQKQISQVQKEIDSLQEQVNSREMKLKIKGEVEVDTSQIPEALEISKVNTEEKKGSSSPDVFTQIGNISKTITSQIIPLAGKMSGIFSPLKDSCKNCFSGIIEQVKLTSGQMDGLKSSVSGIFDNAFTIALNYNGNGDAIIQNLADALNNLLGAIDNVVKSEEFQNWLNNCSDKFREISEKIAQVNWQPLIDGVASIGENIGIIALAILEGLVNIFQWLVENPIVAEILLAIAVAIGLIATAINIYTTAMSIYNTIMPIATAVSTAFGISIGWLIAIVVAIVAAVALVVLAIMNWDSVMTFIKQTVENVINSVIEFFTNLWEQMSFIFDAIWNVISTILGFICNLFKTVFETIWNIVSPIVNAIWNIISTIFQSIWTIISTILNSIWNIFSQIFNWVWQLVSKVFQGIWNIISPIINNVWETIKFVLTKIQEVWSTVWNTISNIVNKVWNGIWNGIKTVINFILGGIEGFVNGTIRGINKLLSGISSVANAIGALIGLDPINLQISTISLPRLAKGGVLTKPTAVLVGEYLGARSNPEIVTPQNIMYETMRRAIEDTEFHSNNGQPIRVQIYWGTKTVVDEIIDGINEKERRTGKAQIKVSYS